MEPKNLTPVIGVFNHTPGQEAPWFRRFAQHLLQGITAPKCKVAISIAVTVICLPLLLTASFAQSQEESFEQIFGKPRAGLPQQIGVPLFVEKQPAEEIQITLAAQADDLSLEAAPLLKAVQPWLKPELLAQFKDAVDPRGNLSLKTLKAAGLDVVFDERKLELRVLVPAELRGISNTQLFGRNPPPGAENALPPSAFSAFVNLRGGLDYVERSASGSDEGLQPFRGGFDGAVNFHNWVLEGATTYTEDADSEWRRGDLRLVHDDPERRIRYSAGDVSYPTTGFQSFMPMAGVTVAKNFSLQPYRVTEPLGQTSFFLKSRSKVEVFVNGQQVQTLQLSAGPQNLRDFLFANGGNNVTMQITDEVGRVETIQLSFFYDTRLLAQGEQEFSYTIGVPSRLTDGGKEYSAEPPAISLFHRIGLTDNLTAGLNLQGNCDQQLFGGEAVWSTRLGTFQPDLALSQVQGMGFDYAARFGYRYFNARSPSGRAWTLSAQYRGEAFAALDNLAPNNSVAWDFSARYSQRLGWGMNGGLGGSYQLSRHGRRDLTGLNLFLTKRFGRNLFADLTLDRKTVADGRIEHRAFVSVTWLFPDHHQSLRSSYDSFSDTARADWQYTAPYPVGGLDGNLGFQRRPDDYSTYGGMRYNGYRAETSVSQDITTPVNSAGNGDSRTSLRLGTALVYADGRFALSRPVHDSFAIIAPHPTLKGQDVRVDPIQDSYAARAGFFGPAVLPDLNPYLVRNVTIDAPDLPLGYDLGSGVYTVRPTYKSGTIIRVGSGATVILEGIVTTADGAPAALLEGEIVSTSDAKLKPAALFTNKRGKFNIEGLKPGVHELRLFSDPPNAIRFEIPKDTVGMYDIGTLRLPETRAPESSPTNEERK